MITKNKPGSGNGDHTRSGKKMAGVTASGAAKTHVDEEPETSAVSEEIDKNGADLDGDDEFFESSDDRNYTLSDRKRDAGSSTGPAPIGDGRKAHGRSSR